MTHPLRDKDCATFALRVKRSDFGNRGNVMGKYCLCMNMKYLKEIVKYSKTGFRYIHITDIRKKCGPHNLKYLKKDARAYGIKPKHT